MPALRRGRRDCQMVGSKVVWMGWKYPITTTYFCWGVCGGMLDRGRDENDI